MDRFKLDGSWKQVLACKEEIITNMQSLYIFNNNLSALIDLKERDPSTKAIWYDGGSKIIRGIVNLYRPRHIYIEESIFSGTHSVLGEELDKDCSVQPIFSATSTDLQGHRRELPVCIFPSNDTHVYLFKPVVKFLKRYNFRVSSLKNETASEALNYINIDSSELLLSKEAVTGFGTLLTANDWGPVELRAHKSFQNHGIRTICLQESVIQFNDRSHRMEWANYPLIQGIPFIGLLNRDVMFLTGNPRYEALAPHPFPSQNTVLINCNFTYGVLEDIRDAWIKDVVDACNAASVNYLIAQHPRDQGDLSMYNSIPSNAGVIHGLLTNSSILVSRFSSLIHEALALGRPVIFYNPHDEAQDYSFDADGTHLIIATNKKQLRDALAQTIQFTSSGYIEDDFFNEYSLRHLGAADGLASQRVGKAIEVVTKLTHVSPGRHISPLKLNYRMGKLVLKRKPNAGLRRVRKE